MNPTPNTKDISGEGVQQALLRLIEGTTIKVHNGSSKRNFDSIDFDIQMYCLYVVVLL